ncbi:hypothetical protein [Acaryochloris marina]|uniref:O-antigen polymerase n=1 Tax=Acaryochloris marina (strain MBIC 11017) TaxID=329726 RepID=B0CA00_ACAM1|nr:hypothetical protein [Acaryochloris marina]ABW25440.1 hypothetical protein AM1_0383 [Acaryochloris marina MBIC11017]
MSLIRSNYFFSKTRPFVLALPWIGLFTQIAINTETSNANYSFIAAAVSNLFILYLYQPYQWYKFPISSLALTGYCILYALGPLLLTALEQRPIIYDLEVPEDLFLHIVLCTGTLIFSHFIYTQTNLFQIIRQKITLYLDRNLNIFQKLDTFSIAILSFFGLISMILVYWLNRGNDVAIIKLIQGFINFAYFPLTALLIQLCNESKKVTKVDWLLNFLFLVLIFIVALGRNSRATFAIPIATYGIGVFLLWIYQYIKIRFKVIVSILILIIFIVPLASNLATSMVMVRALRRDIPSEELLVKTIDQLSDIESIEQYRVKTDVDRLSGYDEKYLSNPFLRRFVNLKFADISLKLGNQLDHASRIEFREFSINRLLSIFPAPFLSFLGFSSEFKKQALSVSWGDQLFFLITRNKYFLGRFWIGHFFGTSLAAFGFLYLFFLGILSIIIFILLDALVITNVSCSQNPIFSPVAIINIYSFFTIFNVGSIVDLSIFIFREWMQVIFLYLIFCKMLVAVSRSLKLA